MRGDPSINRGEKLVFLKKCGTKLEEKVISYVVRPQWETGVAIAWREKYSRKNGRRMPSYQRSKHETRTLFRRNAGGIKNQW